MLYGLVHQRYILTRAGLQAMVGSPPILGFDVAYEAAIGGEV